MLSYFGLGLDYGDDWVGRYYVEQGTFLTLALSPSIEFTALGSASIKKAGIRKGDLVGDYDSNNVNVVNVNLIYRF